MTRHEWYVLNKKPYAALGVASLLVPIAFSLFFRLLGVDAADVLGPFSLTLAISIPSAVTLFVATIYMSWTVSRGIVYDYLPDKRCFLFGVPQGRTGLFHRRLCLHAGIGACAVALGFWISESIYCVIFEISLLTPLAYAVILAATVFSMAIISASIGVMSGSMRATVLNGIIWACLVPNTLANGGPVWVSLISGLGTAVVCLVVAAMLAELTKRKLRVVDCF